MDVASVGGPYLGALILKTHDHLHWEICWPVCPMNKRECRMVPQKRLWGQRPPFSAAVVRRRCLPFWYEYASHRGARHCPCSSEHHHRTPQPHLHPWPLSPSARLSPPDASAAPASCVTFRRVVVPLRGPGQSPVLPFACCVGSLLSVGRCGRCSCWCRFRVRGAPLCFCVSVFLQHQPPPPPSPTPSSSTSISSSRARLHLHPLVCTGVVPHILEILQILILQVQYSGTGTGVWRRARKPTWAGHGRVNIPVPYPGRLWTFSRSVRRLRYFGLCCGLKPLQNGRQWGHCRGERLNAPGGGRGCTIKAGRGCRLVLLYVFAS